MLRIVFFMVLACWVWEVDAIVPSFVKGLKEKAGMAVEKAADVAEKANIPGAEDLGMGKGLGRLQKWAKEAADLSAKVKDYVGKVMEQAKQIQSSLSSIGPSLEPINHLLGADTSSDKAAADYDEGNANDNGADQCQKDLQSIRQQIDIDMSDIIVEQGYLSADLKRDKLQGGDYDTENRKDRNPDYQAER